MAGRNKLPEGLARETSEVTRITIEESAEFSAAARILRIFRSDALRDAIYRTIAEAKKVDPKGFEKLKKQFMDTATQKANKRRRKKPLRSP